MRRIIIMKKKLIASMLLASMCGALLAGCGKGSDNASKEQVIVYNLSLIHI